jgi:hypothetical protein
VAEQSVTLAPGESKVVAFEATPTEARAYQVSVNGLTGSFVAIEVAFPSGEILEITWREVGSDVWYPISEPIPAPQKEYYLGFRAKNTGRTATFKVGIYIYDAFAGWHWMKSPSFDIEAGDERLIEWPLWFGRSGSESVTFHLFSDDNEVDSITVTLTVG